MMRWYAVSGRKTLCSRIGQSGGHCGLVLCVECFSDDIDEEQYPDWRDEPQSLLTAAHARLVYNFVCPQCRYDICCDRVVEPRDDVQYRYLISLITQYLVDVTSHLARSKSVRTASTSTSLWTSSLQRPN
jgi:hypothetical protein